MRCVARGGSEPGALPLIGIAPPHAGLIAAVGLARGRLHEDHNFRDATRTSGRPERWSRCTSVAMHSGRTAIATVVALLPLAQAARTRALGSNPLRTWGNRWRVMNRRSSES